jgi:hypothetical protein
MSTTPGSSLLERHWRALVLLALLVRALYVVFQLGEIQKENEPGWSVTTGDTASYLDPIESLLSGTGYTPDYRMPGVGAPYYLFRLFLDPVQSRNAMVLLQWLLSGISVYLLALLTLRFTGSQRAAWAVYILFLLSAYSSWYDASISSDSLSVTVLIIQMYLLQRAVDRGNLRLLLLSGLLLAWIIFLRPVSAALLPVAAFLVWRYWNAGRSLRAAVLFLVPFMLIDSAWIARNWQVHHEFNPLTNQGLMPDDLTSEVKYEVMGFIQCYGGNYIWWAPGSDMRWYGVWKGGGHLDDEGRKAKAPPAYAYVPAYTEDSLRWIGDHVRLVLGGTMSPADSTAARAEIRDRLKRYSEAFREGSPFHYHVMSRVLMLRNVLAQNGTETVIMTPFSELPLWKKLFKIFQALLFIVTFTAAITAMLAFPWLLPRGELLHVWVPAFTAFTILIYPVGLRMCEWRYLVMIFPLALLMAVHVGNLLVERLRWMGKAAS